MKEIEYEFFALGRQSKDIDWSDWFRLNIRLFEDLKLPITHIIYSHSKRDDDKWRTFSRMKKKILNDLQSDVLFLDMGFANVPKNWSIISQDLTVETMLMIHHSYTSLSFHCKDKDMMFKHENNFKELSSSWLNISWSEIIEYSGGCGVNYYGNKKVNSQKMLKHFDYFKILEKIK